MVCNASRRPENKRLKKREFEWVRVVMILICVGGSVIRALFKAVEKIDITFLCHQWVTVASMAAVPGVEDELSVEATFFFKRTQPHLWR